MTLEILSRNPKKGSAHAPLLFVHGAYTGAWCWDEYFLPWFAERGFEAHAISLRGHGGTPAPGALDLAGIDDYVADLSVRLGLYRRLSDLVDRADVFAALGGTS